MILKRLTGSLNHEQEESQGMVLPLIVSVLVLVALGLGLVWMNSDRTKLAYKIHRLQKEENKREETRAKLEVERDSLLSPHELGKKADAMGLRTALPGQVRRMAPLPKNETEQN